MPSSSHQRTMMVKTSFCSAFCNLFGISIDTEMCASSARRSVTSDMVVVLWMMATILEHLWIENQRHDANKQPAKAQHGQEMETPAFTGVSVHHSYHDWLCAV